jgi:hypothetical protein
MSKMLGEPNVSYDMFGKNCQKETQITRENMKVLDRKMLTPRYHLKPLEYMLQHEFFEESSKEGMISIISVLTERQSGIRKSTIRKTPAETPTRSHQQSLISSFFVKNRPTEEKQTSQRREEGDVEMTSESDTSGDQSDNLELFKQLIEYLS